MEIVMIGVGVVVIGIPCAVIMIAISIMHAAHRNGYSVALVMLAVMVGVMLVVKFSSDPAAAECPPKYTGHATWQGPSLRCTATRALGLTIGGGALAVEKTARLLASGELFSETGWKTLNREVSRAVKYLSPVVAGFILFLACCLGIAKPFSTDISFRTSSLLWSEGLLVVLACLGTLPWAFGLVLAYAGTVFWPMAVLHLWLSGLAIGVIVTVAIIVKTVMSARSQFTGERTIPQSN